MIQVPVLSVSRSGALAAALETFSCSSRASENAFRRLGAKVEELTLGLRLAERRLMRSLEDGERRDERAKRRSRLEMERMAAEIACGIRDPLGCLELTASLLRDEARNDRARAELARFLLGIRDMTRVTQDLLAFTRPVSPARETLDARDVLERAHALMAPACAAGGIELRMAAGAGLCFDADAGLLQQVLLDLVENALEATRAPGAIGLWARSAGAEIELRVNDTGCGMDAQTLARVFDPLFTTRERGTGLGLPVSRLLAEAQGARIALQSVPARGTAAILAFPARTSVPSTTRRSVQETPSTTTMLAVATDWRSSFGPLYASDDHHSLARS